MTKLERAPGLFLVGLVALVLAGAVPTGTRAAATLTVYPEPMLPRLLVPGDRIVVGYTVETAGVKAPTGVLYVRDDLHARYQRVALKLGRSIVNGSHPRLSAVLPSSLTRAHRIFLYAVIRDSASGSSATLPARGAAAPVSSWVLHKPVVVKLGTHVFGRTRAADMIVARASAAQVGWDLTGPIGPQTFLVDRDRSVWLEDEVNGRMLVWRASKPNAVARAVPLPSGGAALGDIAFGPNGSLYVTRWHQPGFVLELFRVDASGKVLWQSSAGASGPDTGVAANQPLWVGPDGALYCRISAPGLSWPTSARSEYGLLPLATSAGKPVPPEQQLDRALWGYDPAPNGRRFVVDVAPNQAQLRELRLALLRRNGTVERSWRVISRSWFSPGLWPQLVDGHPLVDLLIARPGGMEHVILHLSPMGASARFSLPWSIWGDSLYADVRPGPGAVLYRLSTSHSSGIVVGRYSLARGNQGAAKR